jgi:hypothetical protein
MAIVVEQERSGKGGMMKLLVWGLILLVILVGAYYLFFKRPDVIPNLAAPAAFKQANELQGVKLDPGAVVQSQTFQSLRPQAPEQPTPVTGRTNPFQPL